MTHFGLCRIMCFRPATQTSYRFEERTTNNQQRRKLIRAAGVNRSPVLREVESWKSSACDAGRALIQNQLYDWFVRDFVRLTKRAKVIDAVNFLSLSRYLNSLSFI